MIMLEGCHSRLLPLLPFEFIKEGKKEEEGETEEAREQLEGPKSR